MGEKHQGDFEIDPMRIPAEAAQKLLQMLESDDESFQVAVLRPTGNHSSGLELMSIDEFNRRAYMGLIDQKEKPSARGPYFDWVFHDPSNGKRTEHKMGPHHRPRAQFGPVMVFYVEDDDSIKYFDLLDKFYRKRGHVETVVYLDEAQTTTPT